MLPPANAAQQSLITWPVAYAWPAWLVVGPYRYSLGCSWTRWRGCLGRDGAAFAWIRAHLVLFAAQRIQASSNLPSNARIVADYWANCTTTPPPPPTTLDRRASKLQDSNPPLFLHFPILSLTPTMLHGLAVSARFMLGLLDVASGPRHRYTLRD